MTPSLCFASISESAEPIAAWATSKRIVRSRTNASTSASVGVSSDWSSNFISIGTVRTSDVARPAPDASSGVPSVAIPRSVA